ncbi:hypothetical protein HanXRQr2_Chr09g0411971 [Helianthus annuus]|uniref:Uncharacterized protein n=1 Tax=Helianthus annuus TaxID=4232 RepID=A0A9K3NAI5_HELAN|nr:hypothetical protein HanXRQr2_Chr09g0411971 [Helianthus annuus]KAJ0544276.1 hypothetical protein HanHA89_Chr09g0359791 [Helianthus annuus]
MVAYNKKQAMGGKDEDDDSDKSKSEVNNEEDRMMILTNPSLRLNSQMFICFVKSLFLSL